MEQWTAIRYLAAKGRPRRRIARECGVSRNTVRSAIQDEVFPSYQRASPVQQTLEQCRESAEEGITKRLLGVRMLQTARAQGYQGSAATFYRWLGAIRLSIQQGEAPIRFETDPGIQCQFDWSPYTLTIAGRQTCVVIYAVVLGFSRRVHWHVSLAEDQDAVLDGLEAGIRHFGGSCRSVVVDNAKAMVLMHRGSDLHFNDTFLAFCAHYAIHPIAGTPYHPQGKGKIENPFRPLEGRFLRGREWESFEQLVEQLAEFEAEWEQRIHATTRQRPAERFLEEQPLLQPLPPIFLGARRFLRRANSDGTISWRGVRYCIPEARPRQVLQVRATQGRHMHVYATDGTLMVTHAIQPPGSPLVLAPQALFNQQRRRQARLDKLADEFRSRFAAAPDTAQSFLQNLLEQHPNHPERALDNVLQLLQAVPEDAAVAALADAVECRLCKPDALQVLLTNRLRRCHTRPAQPLDVPAGHIPIPSLDVQRDLRAYAHLLPTHQQGG